MLGGPITPGRALYLIISMRFNGLANTCIPCGVRPVSKIIFRKLLFCFPPKAVSDCSVLTQSKRSFQPVLLWVGRVGMNAYEYPEEVQLAVEMAMFFKWLEIQQFSFGIRLKISKNKFLSSSCTLLCRRN